MNILIIAFVIVIFLVFLFFVDKLATTVIWARKFKKNNPNLPPSIDWAVTCGRRDYVEGWIYGLASKRGDDNEV